MLVAMVRLDLEAATVVVVVVYGRGHAAVVVVGVNDGANGDVDPNPFGHSLCPYRYCLYDGYYRWAETVFDAPTMTVRTNCYFVDHCR